MLRESGPANPSYTQRELRSFGALKGHRGLNGTRSDGWSVKSQINILKGSQGKETKAENHDPH